MGTFTFSIILKDPNNKKKGRLKNILKNAVIIGCGHGGLCYNCSIDICVTSGMCPFCRADIGQVVTIGLGRYEVDDDGRKVVPVIGPK